MKRNSEDLLSVLRDVIARRRVGLPMPPTVDVDELLVDAADTIESLEDELDETNSLF